jgi:multicomponent Na+:H+ antiporter subunit B
VIRRAVIVVVVALFALIFAGLAADYDERQSLRPLAEGYVRLVPQELGAPNVITGILLTYRALDTLGEVAVLFMVAAAMGLLLSAEGKQRGPLPERTSGNARAASEIVQSGAQILVPLISIFAAYIIMNGHLSAGGGFQGGAVIASAVLLVLLANPETRIQIELLGATESAAGVLFVLAGVAGLVFAGGFLDSRVLPLGRFGAFFSAGAIPVFSVLLGIKVGCELSVIVDRFRT